MSENSSIMLGLFIGLVVVVVRNCIRLVRLEVWMEATRREDEHE